MNKQTLIPPHLRRHARRIISLCAMISAGLATVAGAQTVAFTNNPVATTYGGASDNPPGLNIGVTFHVNSPGIEVFQLGAFDWQGDGLNASHTVTLFQNQTALGSVTVPAGTSAPLISGFRFGTLSTPIYLPAGTYSVVSYQMNGNNAGNDPYGENNASGFNGSANLSPGDGIYQFTTNGSPLYPNSIAGGYDFQSASFTYTNLAAVNTTWSGLGADNNWSTSGNWNTPPTPPSDLTFAGSTRLTNTNDLTGFVANSITFDAAAGAFTLDGNAIIMGGTVGFNGNPAAPITQTVNLGITWTASETINTPTNGNLSLGGGITSGNDVTKIGAGTLTLSGTNAIENLDVNGGTSIITGSTTISGNGGLGTGNYDRFYVADGDAIANCNGTLIIQPGATLAVNGTFNDAAVIGRDSGTGTMIQNGGTFTFNPANNQLFLVGASGTSTATRAEYHMNGGVFDMSTYKLGIGLGVNGYAITGAVYQVGGVITNVGNLDLGTITPDGYGEYDLAGGSIYIGSGGITTFDNKYGINLGGGTIVAQASWGSSLNMTLTGSNGPVTFNPNGNTITLTGSLSGTGGLTVNGAGALVLNGVNSYTGNATVTAGSTLEFDLTGTTFASIRLDNGANLYLNYTGTRVAASFYTNGVALPVGTYNAGNLPGFITGSGDLQVASGISTGIWDGGGADNNWSTGGNWDQDSVPVFPIGLTFQGSTRLTNNNDLSSVTVSSVTFDSAAGAFELDGNDITLNGAVGFNGNPAAPITQTVNLNMAWGADKTIDTPTNGNLALGGNITTSKILTKTGAGTLTLGGVDSSFSGYIGNGGTTTLTGSMTVTGDGSSRFVLGNQNSFNNTLVIQPGAALNVNGSYVDALVIGRDSGSGTVIQNGGTFTFSPGNNPTIYVAAASNPGTKGEYDMNGGVLDMGGNTLSIALGDAGVQVTGVVNQAAGTIDNVFNLKLGAVRATGHGFYTLSGGRINIDFGGITTDDGLYSINLGGGTVGAISDWSSSLNMNLTNLNGSVAFDPNGNTITLSGMLSGNGGLIVTNFGTLNLTGTNSYTGDTIVSAGTTLQLDAPGSTPSAFRIVDGANLNLNYSGTHTVLACYTNGVSLPNGTYNAGNLPGFISGSGDLLVAGLVFSSEPQSQLVYLNQGQSATFTSSVTGGSAAYQWYLNGNPISGATSSSLTLSDLQITSGGNLYVVATGSSGSITSSVVALTIYAVNNNVFAYDGFAYSAGSVDGASQDGGFGWAGPWQQVDGTGVIITSGNLVGGASVPAGYDSRSISNCIEVPSNAQTRSGRFFDCSSTGELYTQGFIDANGNIGADGKTIYLSFLQQPDRTSGFYEMEFHKGNLSDPGRIGGIGNDAAGNNVNLRAPNSVNNHSLGAGTTAVNFYVVRIDYKAGNDDVFVYRNPTSNTEPATPTLVVSNVADMSFNGLSVAAYNGPDVKHDEIRLGATWQDAIGLAVSNLLPPTKTANGYKVQFACTPNYSYRIQRATNITGPWTDLSTNVGPMNAYVEFEDTNAPSGQAFYRTITP